jgi:hypothetical protein
MYPARHQNQIRRQKKRPHHIRLLAAAYGPRPAFEIPGTPFSPVSCMVKRAEWALEIPFHTRKDENAIQTT